MTELKLKPITAYTINSADDERKSSDKGIYRNYSIASQKAPKSGWYGSDGTVETLNGIYEDENGDVYRVTKFGKSTDDLEVYTKSMSETIKSKLTPEELEFLKIK